MNCKIASFLITVEYSINIYVYLYMFIYVSTYNDLFTHSSVIRHLVCYPTLTIIFSIKLNLDINVTLLLKTLKHGSSEK